jgi:protein-S-isoprenylcysteine O-methyltransferase Ste14
MIRHSILAVGSLLLRNLLFSGPAVLLYAVGLPIAARALDRYLEPPWPLPAGAAVAGWALVAAGAALAAWSAWALAALGRGTPNPIAPPERLVVVGPYRHSRNPLMVGGWIAGAGLVLVLRSVSLAAFYAVIVAAGSAFVKWFEEPQLVQRFGAAYRDYMRATPRWGHAVPHHARCR